MIMNLKQRQNEKMNSIQPKPYKPTTRYVDKDKNRIEVDLSKEQIKQNKLRTI